ncbi:MAG TPA: DEAD/DEAH box helicase family protein [Saprospiraceae bacterium]|nr:DEAD/DEAH box helicase family protein [Saprospiraceae bacterium]
MAILLDSNINLFRSLFKGRDDVFAIRWEKGGKSGYTPAYQFDPYLYRQHKMGGGTFQNFNAKSYLPLTNEQIAKHLNGGHQAGIYPLLSDNTSWLLAADFDGKNWAEECRAFLNACAEKDIPAYLERSRSGQGGHVWIFFERPYPAIRSRKIFIQLLEQAGVFSVFDKGSSFDRLFPNQDFLSGKGLGNLIALPFYRPCMEKGNSCFIDPNTLAPYSDQWAFLTNIRKVDTEKLDFLYRSLQNTSTVSSPGISPITPCKISILLDNEVRIARSYLPTLLINFLKEEFSFASSEFIIKKNAGKNTWGTNRFFKCIRETENEIIVPRGGVGKIIRFCREQKIDHDFRDARKKLSPVSFSSSIHLKAHQQPAVEATSKKDMGVIVAPPGSGKTVMGLKIIADKQQPTLIVVHRKQLVDQWMERIQGFLGLSKSEIGQIGQGKFRVGKKITVSTIQSLAKVLEKPQATDLRNAFGTILIDECHHIPAETFRDTIDQLHAYYVYGLTATPFRKYNDGRLIFLHLGDIIAEMAPQETGTHQVVRIVVRETELDVPFNAKTDKFELLSKVLVHDSARNRLILKDIKKELDAGRKVVIITERKDHIEALYQYLKQSYEVITLSGEDSESARTVKWKALHDGQYQALLTTGQFFGEGTDLNNVTCLFLVYPFSFEGKLIQYIGRVQRGEVTPVIYDYHDRKVDYLHRLFLKRNVYYRKIAWQATLFDEPLEEEIIPKDEVYVLEENIKIPFENLDFQYGCVGFSYTVAKFNLDLQFEIEHLHIRPEFDVLKPYFAKAMHSRFITVDLFAEFENGTLISQLATSNDLAGINQEIIESVKFRFVEKEFVGRQVVPQGTNQLLDAEQVQNVAAGGAALFDSGEELLDAILKNEQVKHFRQLRYLADRHERTILKLRFVLSPFSFVFLLAGEEQFHIVLETLDTEEATYIWHIPKDKHLLREALKHIERDLNLIRQHGRQYFLDTKPAGFIRVMHDYSDGRKGFVVWKDMVEERLG